MKFLKNLIKKLINLNLKYKIIILILFLILIGGGVYFKLKNKSQANQELQTTQVTKGNLVSSLTLSGNVESSNLIAVMTKASGVVSQVYVTDGQQVKAGDKIAQITLDSEGKNSQSSAWASYLSAKNNLESAKIKAWSLESSMWAAHDKFKTQALDSGLAETDPVYIQTNRDWLAAEASYKNQGQSVTQAQAAVTEAWNNFQLYQAVITAPQDGVIVGLSLAEGLSLSYSESSSGNASTQTVATLKTSGSPVALFNVTEVDINQIQVGQEVSLSLDSLEDKKFTGEIAAVDRVGSETSGVTQYPVLIKFDQDDSQILTHMAVSAEIVFDSKENVLIIPSSAVTQIQDKKIVKVMQDGQIRPVEIETGLENDTQVEVVSGLSEGDQIITGSSTTTSSSQNQKTGSMMMMGGPGMGPR